MKIPVSFIYYEKRRNGYLTEHRENRWFLHSEGDVYGIGSYFIDMLVFNGSLYFQSGNKELTAQMDYFADVLAGFYG